MSATFKKASGLRGDINIPGDKSISHRSIMLGALATGTTEVTNFLDAADCNSTIKCFKRMGIDIDRPDPESIIIHGKGLHGLSAPEQDLDVGNSGTTIRLLSGILAAQSFDSKISGDDSICRRPMGRIIKPLMMMGADIKSNKDNDCAPLNICGRPLKGIHYESPIASAQVKSSILLAGLYADGETSVSEPYLSRNHTEKMISLFGGTVTSEGTTCTVKPNPDLKGQQITVPGDISSAAYFIALGLLAPDSEILIKNVGINPTRDGIIEVVRSMGGNIQLLNMRGEHEPVADILVKSSELTGTIIEKDLVPRLIDEIPIIAVMASLAKGRTIIRDAEELKVKESDRLTIVTENLNKMGAYVIPTDDGMIIEGTEYLVGTVIGTRHDHRIAMAFSIAGLLAERQTEIIGKDCVNISYPNFYNDLNTLMQ